MSAGNGKAGVVNIRGKEYQTVALRVQHFREQHPDWCILTQILHCDDTVVRMLCQIVVPAPDGTGVVLATGHSEEYRKASEINRTSAVENCETSAIGRALAALGFGGTEFATANEMDKAQRTAKALEPATSIIPNADKHTARQAAVDAFDSFPAEEQAFLRDEAMKIIALHDEGGDVYNYVEAAHYETDEKLAIWSLLPSNVRTTIQKRRAAELASQA